MSRNIPYLPDCVPMTLQEDEFVELVEKTRDWAIMHGAAMRSKTNFSEDSLCFAPFVLLPTTFPRKEFEKAVEVQLVLNELMHRVAYNREFLTSTLKETIQVDEFTANLFKIYETVEDEGVTQPLSLGMVRNDLMLESECASTDKSHSHTLPFCGWKQVELNTIASGFGWLGPISADIQRYAVGSASILLTCHIGSAFAIAGLYFRVALGLLRSDYMIQSEPANRLKQVEINTIASSFGGITTIISRFHRFVLQELGHFDKLDNLPGNDALGGLCQGMLEAWKIYNNPKAVILFIVENVTYNICDQRFHEFKIRELNPQVKVIRRNLTEIGDGASLNSNNELIIDNQVVAVIYFRAGYEPGHYPSKKEWDARLLMERSRAIKSPSIQYHLAGTKKVQQALSKSGVIEMFLNEAKKVEAVKDIFTGLYGLDFDEFGDQAVHMALDDPERFVLKPQREGGGNNIYGIDVRKAMLEMKDSKERTAWILMERLSPPLSKGYIVRPGGPIPPQLCDMVSELGIFGVVIGDSQKILINKQVGHMLRTKVSTANEGGVAAGLGALDSPFLID